MTIGTILNLKFNGTFVGQDRLGNQYFVMRQKNNEGKNKRSVWYKTDVISSPPLWHAWLHYTCDETPKKEECILSKTSKSNQTSTENLCCSDKHISKGDNRKKATSGYLAWDPNN